MEKMGPNFLAGSAVRTRINDFKLKEDCFRLAIYGKSFYSKCGKTWSRFPRVAVDAPSPDTFKIRLDGALSKLIFLKMSLLITGGLK